MQLANRKNMNRNILNVIEELTGEKVSKTAREVITRGAGEIDLVHSGLEESMSDATKDVLDVWHNTPEIPDMRTAAYVVAIDKVGRTYNELGIFP